MRANIPKNSPHPDDSRTTMELDGIYLRAMQEISAHLMDHLPAEESLWLTLSQTEALLMEAQLQNAPLHDVFGSGGTAAFCQSIVDEYRQTHPQTGSGDPTPIPASLDPSLHRKPSKNEPKGGVNYHRKRRGTAILITGMSLVFLLLACWYTGLLHFLTAGSAFYLDELHNFTSVSEPIADAPTVRFTIPLAQATDIGLILYSDGEGHTITLTEIQSSDYRLNTGTEEHIQLTDYRRWALRLQYPVDAGYLSVSYIEPGMTGEAMLTLPDGTVHTEKISLDRSGAAERGYEYVVLKILELPADIPVEGYDLTVTLSAPKRVIWTRTGVGDR